MFWAIAALGFVLGVAGIGVSAVNAASSRTLQKKANAQNMITSSKSALETNYRTITNTLVEISATNQKISDNEYNIQVNNDWLKMYQDMLNGTGDEDNVLQSQYNVLNNNIQLQQQVADLYLKTSEIEKQNAINTGYDNYAQMMKQKSLMNVMAGASGELQGSYNNAALKQQNQIRQYIGDDLVFNTSGTYEGLSSGSFLQQYAVLNEQINAQIETNNLNILSAQNNLKQQMYEWSTEAESKQHSNEDMTQADENYKKTLETYEATIKEAQASAVDAMKDYIANAETAGYSASEAVEYMDRQYELYKNIGYEISTIDYDKIDQEIEEKYKGQKAGGGFLSDFLLDTGKSVDRALKIADTDESKLRQRAKKEQEEATTSSFEEKESRYVSKQDRDLEDD